jgi:simple sugar transport system substrate-binding protein
MYLETAQAVIDGSWEQGFEWRGPDWDDINNPDTSNAGWVFGPGLEADAEASDTVQEFIDGLASGDINVWTGPINLQDGTEYIPAGRAATDTEIWYLPLLPEGVTGASE